MEVISCELLGEGGDFCVVGIDYFMEGLLGEGISLIVVNYVNVKYDFFDSLFWNVWECVYKLRVFG